MILLPMPGASNAGHRKGCIKLEQRCFECNMLPPHSSERDIYFFFFWRFTPKELDTEPGLSRF